jgi:DNA-binding LacI/PurR family transcriptional regulator
VLTANTRLYGFAGALEGIEAAARVAGFTVGVRVVEPGAQAADDAVSQAVELGGALIVIALEQKSIAALHAVPSDFPSAAIVVTPTADEAVGKPWVWIDDRKAAIEATNYLLGLGHRTVHYLSVPAWADTNPRLAGWRSALVDAGAPVPEPLCCSWEPRSGFEAGQLLTSDPDVTAVLCGNDDIAIGALRAMHHAGRSVPADVSIVGFDDIPIALYCSPSLTTVRQDFVALGRLCFARLLSLLDPSSIDQWAPFPDAKLIIRESAGPPHKRRRRGPVAGRPRPLPTPSR